ncbi:ABC transporter ATP-binding protein [Floricoccus penangensis]|uniref:ABC transporter ATP-binding protein n=1 Tax=Floricoccus penangensis TaxID=1859475 RepID=A0A9Q5P077_9LACT|nr:ABC transporter ATP-binding protein [Floricoccus penangensis]OFI45986.1 ABC transporter ATP-binding protein [Floricoccus penangensis]
MTNILEINNLTKSFGSNKILDGINLQIPSGAIYGFIGKNGAGKTTTMKIILGLLQADEGEVLVNGEKVKFGQSATNKYIGYLPDVPEFYGYMTAKEYLMLCGKITGMSKIQIKKRSDELLNLVGLDDDKKKIKSYSRGMKQRLGIAQALLNKPKLLLCDEPTSALDPLGRNDVLEILKKIKDETTVIFSTHILSDVESICDHVAFLNGGKIVLNEKLVDLKKIREADGFEIVFVNHEDCVKFNQDYMEFEARGDKTLVLKNGSQEDMLFAMGNLAEKKIMVERIEMLEPSLDSLFMEVIDDGAI